MVDAHLHGAAAQPGAEFVGERDHRRPVEQRLADARREIGRTRPIGAEADARTPRQPPIDIRHHARRPFVGGEDEFDAVGLAQFLHIVDPTAARHAEDVGDADFLQGFDDLACNTSHY